MAKKAEVEKYIQQIVDKLNDVGPIILEGWGGSAMFVISDLHTGWLLKMAMDGSVESCSESTDESAAGGVLEMDSDTFVGIWGTKKMAAIDAYDSGKMRARGSQDVLVKIMPNTV